MEAERVEAHLVTPVRLTAVSCYPDSCRIDKSDPGRIVATIDGLGPNEAMIISAELTEAAVPISSAAQTSLPPPPSGEPAGIPANVVTGLAGLFCVGGLLLALALILIAGRDEFRAPDIDGGGQRRLFPWQLSRQITLAEAPPDELRAWQGGILVAEDVTDDHPAAWLLELAADGDAQIYGPHLRPTIRYTVDDSTENLESIFRSSGAIHLGNYNTSASVGWDDPLAPARRLARRFEAVDRGQPTMGTSSRDAVDGDDGGGGHRHDRRGRDRGPSWGNSGDPSRPFKRGSRRVWRALPLQASAARPNATWHEALAAGGGIPPLPVPRSRTTTSSSRSSSSSGSGFFGGGSFGGGSFGGGGDSGGGGDGGGSW